jgi:electron transfer flavoprotein alpha subunit
VAARATLGDQYEALVTTPLETPLVVTLQPGAVGDALTPSVARHNVPVEGRVLTGTLPAGLATLPPDPKQLRIADAERIVAFGRGAFSREAITLVEQLAGLLGATVAGTRPAADEGWLPFAKQVGLTGAIVAPKLYVAVGISGAPYHMVGVKNPETLIAINRDAEAPILGAAHLGIVGDLYSVLPALIRRLEQGQSIAVPGRAAVTTAKPAHSP